jgi:uncharacterized membrane protein
MELAVLILLHVFFAILWGGGAIVIGFFIVPSVIEAGPGGGAVMAGVFKRKFPVLMTVSAFVVLLTGIRLYMLSFTGDWVTTPRGIVLTLGTIAGLGAFLIGVLVQRPVGMRMGALGAEIAAKGGPPSPEQAAEMEALRTRMSRVARITAWHLVAAALLMASNRVAAFL